MIEEQALRGVHKIGQEKKATTIRHLMRDSFDEIRSDDELYMLALLSAGDF